MIAPSKVPVRALMPADFLDAKPVYAVWELTMKCDQPCQHCGSRAGAARVKELETHEVLEVAASLARLGCREVALIGGEAYLRDDLHEIVSFLAGSGIRVVMQTGGRAFTEPRARALFAAGLTGLGVSVDGPAHVHDELRGNVGSHEAAIRALQAGRAAGLITTANTQINRLNAHLLRETCAELRSHGIQTWQVQLTVPMGKAADRPEWILEPWRMVEVVDTLAAIQREALETHVSGVPFNVFANNNIGYFGPHEQLLRSRPGGGETHWRGCRAGINVLGIESDGTVKGCPSLPTAPYAGGNVRELSLERIWEQSEVVRFARDRDTSELWGHCATCYYADECRAGCSWTAHCTLGKRGNNPFCYHRVKQLQKQGIRERLVQKERAPNVPYDHGVFELVEEAWDAPPLPAPEPVVPKNARRRLAVVAGP
jgi:radical SAM protein with 4Fe4S-binding SPASM domain